MFQLWRLCVAFSRICCFFPFPSIILAGLVLVGVGRMVFLEPFFLQKLVYALPPVHLIACFSVLRVCAVLTGRCSLLFFRIPVSSFVISISNNILPLEHDPSSSSSSSSSSLRPHPSSKLNLIKCTVDRFNRVSWPPSCKLPQSWHTDLVMICPLAQAHDSFLVWLPQFTDSSAVCLFSYNCKPRYSSLSKSIEKVPFLPRWWRGSCIQGLFTRTQSQGLLQMWRGGPHRGFLA